MAIAYSERSLASRQSPPPVSIVAAMAEHTFQNVDVYDKCVDMANLFSPHLQFFGGKLDIPLEALRGFLIMDEANMCTKTTLGSPIPWRQLKSPPSLARVDINLHDQFLDDWMKIPVAHTNVEYVENVYNDDVTLYHGTIAKCAYSIVKIGFLPGPNGHVKNRKYYKGAFMSKGFSPACYRSDMTRHVEADNIYNFSSCPCVLELRTSSARLVNYHRHNPDLFVLPGSRGKALQGLRVEAIHFNKRFVQNYRALHSSSLRAQIVARGGVVEVMCGGRRQLSDFSTCGKVSFDPWTEFVKLGQAWVCRECYALWR